MKRDLAALGFAMVFPSIMTWVYFVAVADQGDAAGTLVAGAYGLGKFIQFAFPAVFVFWTDRKQLKPAAPGWGGLVFALGFSLTVSAAALALYFFALKGTHLLHAAPDKIADKLRQFGLDSVGGFVAMAVFISVFHSLLEEYYWRWFVFGWWKRWVRPVAAGGLASLGFMAHHVIVLAVYFPGAARFIQLVVPLSLGIACGGAIWCYVYQKTGSLYATWLSHALIDGAIMVIGIDLVWDRLVGR